MNMHQFYTEHLKVGYQDQVIIEDLSVRIPANQVTVLLGSNGCGKSTLLKSMARLLNPVHGHFILDGTAISKIPTRRLAQQLGLLPQSPIVPSGITVEDLVARGRFPYQSLFSKMTEQDYSAVAWAMEQMGIEELAHRNVDELSGGQRQRVWLALALAQETDILLLDEPTTYLDVAHQISILDCVKRLNQQKGTTTVVILHDINLSIRYADYILAMKDGKLIAQGKPSELITPELIKEVYDLECVVISDPETGLPYIIPKASKLCASAVS